ncbi:MAG: NAD(P)-binding domain-containing protein [Chloroflexi bacterium]|nr:NAD(P)-binding domain-containing protein [Chloroflexota bacterium]
MIVGAGSAGLATSYFLKKLRIDHLVVERGEVANTWITERWDGFHLVNPNWAVRLPGFHYAGTEPEGYLSKVETIDYLQNYARLFGSPVQTGVDISSIRRSGNRYELATNAGDLIETRCVIVATGAFGVPKYPDFVSDITNSIDHVHSAHYKNPDSLAEGAVMVVGSGQSGAQIAEELHEAGRDVFLSVGSAGRRPRRYRGRDSSWWNYTMGSFDRTIENVSSVDDARFGSSAHTSGSKGGHDIYLRQLAKQDVTLFGPVTGGHGDTLTLRTDLQDVLKAVDDYPVRWKRDVDAYVEKNGIQVPPDNTIEPPDLSDWPRGNGPASLNLGSSGITTIIWATGFEYDFDWIKLPVTGGRNYPDQLRGVTRFPGLYFMGLQWMFGSKSAQFIGVGEDAEYVANHVAKNYG